MTKETPTHRTVKKKGMGVAATPDSSAPETKPVVRINVRVMRHVNNLRAGDKLLVDDTPSTRAHIRNGYYQIIPDTDGD